MIDAEFTGTCPTCQQPSAGAELRRLRQLERVVLNQLGTTDPREVAGWITRARKALSPEPCDDDGEWYAVPEMGARVPETGARPQADGRGGSRLGAGAPAIRARAGRIQGGARSSAPALPMGARRRGASYRR